MCVCVCARARARMYLLEIVINVCHHNQYAQFLHDFVQLSSVLLLILLLLLLGYVLGFY